MKKYDIKKTLLKGLKCLIFYGVPVLIDRFVVNYPEYAQITVGTILVMLSNWLKIRFGVRLP